MKRVSVRQQDERIQQERQSGDGSIDEGDESLNIYARIKKKDSMYVTFKGVIETGKFSFTSSCSVFYIISAGQKWKIAEGQRSGISQIAHRNDKEKVTWNFPFNITFEAKDVINWPQLSIILYGKDMFGRSTAKAYGNIRLPSQQGCENRKIRTFESIPPSNYASCCAFLMGYINQIKGIEKILTSQEDRQQFQMRTNGQARLKIEVLKYNFEEYGFE